MSESNQTALREMVLRALPEDTSTHGRTPEARHVYLPGTHAKALRPDSMLVTGARGSGKSFWWAALQDTKTRSLLGKAAGINQETIISTGFGERPNPEAYPSKDVLAALINEYDPRSLWKAIIFKHFLKDSLPEGFAELQPWGKRVEWILKNPETVDGMLYKRDQELIEKRVYHLVLFDALDRTADNWESMHKLMRGLLQVLLDFRGYTRIRLKVFVRPDQVEVNEVATFPDASKIITQQTELNWPKQELYGLLWQYLSNELEAGALFRNLAPGGWSEHEGIWTASEGLRNHEDVQRKLFHQITGPYMGRNPRRGFPYTWLPNHLGDTRGQVSPRSFIAALQHAASNPRPNQEFALHHESIKSGVQKASQIRVNEVLEDYPWVKNLMNPLAGVSLPCKSTEIVAKWLDNQVLEQLEDRLSQTKFRLPPKHLSQGPQGVLKDLEELAILEVTSDGRINLPDVYRVGYGMGRRGGIKPLGAFQLLPLPMRPLEETNKTFSQYVDDARYLHEQGRHSEALTALDQAEQRGADVYTKLLRSKILESRGSGEEASRLRMTMIDGGSKHTAFFADEARYLHDQGKSPEALALLERAEQRGAADPFTQSIRTSILEARGSGDEASRLRFATIDAGSRNPALFTDEARYLHEQGRNAEALALLDLAEKRGASDAFTQTIRARILEACGSEHEASRIRMAEIDAGSRHPALYNDEARYLLEHGRPAEALVLIDRAERQGAADAFTLAIRARILDILTRGSDVQQLPQAETLE